MLFNNKPFIVIILLCCFVSMFFLTSATTIREEVDAKPLKPRLFSSKKTREICSDTIIIIYNQQDFNKLQNILKTAITCEKKRIEIRVKKGTYSFKQNHIDLQKIVNNNLSIQFVGNNCKLIPEGNDILYGKEQNHYYDYNYSYLNSEGEDISFWSPFYITDTLIQIVNKAEKSCRIHVPSSFSMDLRSLDNTYIQYTEWYYTRICKIDSIKNGYVYYKVPELFEVKDGYNVNYDYILMTKYPRFRIFNPLSASIEEGRCIHEGLTGTFCRIWDSNLKSVSFEGFSFNGNKANQYLFYIKNTSFHDYLLIFDCNFTGQKGSVAFIGNSNNVYIQKCHFVNQYSTVIESDWRTVRTELYDNHFVNCGLGMSNSFCSICSGQDYLISNNRFMNYGYGAVAVGIWYKIKQKIPSRGVVEQNVIYNTEEYLHNIDQRGLIDGGAIYLSTINDGAIVRYNFINNISGIGANRGIYCDDGAYGFSVYGNVIMNVYNSNYIDSRKVPLPNLPTNTNIYIGENIIGGQYKYVANDDVKNNNCRKGCNFILYKEGTQQEYESVVDNIDDVEDDIFLVFKKTKEGAIVVPRETRLQLRKLPFYNYIKKYIKGR